jgi:hypothetical protein
VLVLRSRGIEVTEEQEAQFTSCTDQQQLDGWLKRVGIVSSADELFE